MLSLSAEHIYDVPRSLNGASSQLLNLLFAELSGMILGPRYSILHLFGIILFKHVLWLSWLGWHAQGQLGNVCTALWSGLVELHELPVHCQVLCNNLDVFDWYIWSWTWVKMPAYLRMCSSKNAEGWRVCFWWVLSTLSFSLSSLKGRKNNTVTNRCLWRSCSYIKSLCSG